MGPLRAPFVLSLKPFTLPFYLTFPTWPAVEDSGHRDYFEEEVEELVQQYMQTLLKKPMLRSFGGKPKMCKDRLLKLLDGKKVTAAVRKCYARRCEEAEGAEKASEQVEDAGDRGKLLKP